VTAPSRCDAGQGALSLAAPVRRIRGVRRRLPPGRSALVAITGIDGAGKGWIAEHLCRALSLAGLRAGVVGVDGWLNLPHVRFGTSDPAEHFYRHALRFDALFRQLVEPLRANRSVRLEADFAEERARSFRRHVYEYHDLDVILLEGIFLLKREHRRRYDLSLWLECSFETALARAIARAQEGLLPDETANAYRSIYFPAQRIHLERDDPRGAADLLLVNDPRGMAPAPRGP
jgi:uridine kinase